MFPHIVSTISYDKGQRETVHLQCHLYQRCHILVGFSSFFSFTGLQLSLRIIADGAIRALACSPQSTCSVLCDPIGWCANSVVQVYCLLLSLSLSLCFPKAPVSFGDSYSRLSLPDKSWFFIMFIVRVTFIILEGGQDRCSKSYVEHMVILPSSKRFPLCGSMKFTVSYPYSRQFILWFCMFKKKDHV